MLGAPRAKEKIPSMWISHIGPILSAMYAKLFGSSCFSCRISDSVLCSAVLCMIAWATKKDTAWGSKIAVAIGRSIDLIESPSIHWNIDSWTLGMTSFLVFFLNSDASIVDSLGRSPALTCSIPTWSSSSSSSRPVGPLMLSMSENWSDWSLDITSQTDPSQDAPAALATLATENPVPSTPSTSRTKVRPCCIVT